MVTSVFPLLPGLTWSVIKTPSWATRYQRAISGRELRVSDYANPIWQFTLTYSLLRDSYDARAGLGVGPGYPHFPNPLPTVPGTGYNELRTLMGFYLQQRGPAIPFLFDDPTDNLVFGQVLAPVINSPLEYQLYRDFGPPALVNLSEVITAPNVVTSVYINGVVQSPSNYSVNFDTGVITFMSAPGGTVSVDYSYYFRVRFSEDSAQFENFLYQFWELKQLKFTSIVGLI